ncbi:MAG TPA: DinB family protein, partial [Acidimicrobiales bacterium]|nr:DinB family protein [Acidimicrobiales bacterium]
MPPPDVSAHLERLRTTGRDLVSLVASAEPSALRREPEPDEWSAATVVCHLADAELVYGVRLRLIVAEERPVLTPYDEQAWADRFGDLDEDPKDTLARFRTLRDANLRLLDALVDGEWDRTGVHQQRGLLSVSGTVKLMAEHDRTHLDQIRRALA